MTTPQPTMCTVCLEYVCICDDPPDVGPATRTATRAVPFGAHFVENPTRPIDAGAPRYTRKWTSTKSLLDVTSWSWRVWGGHVYLVNPQIEAYVELDGMEDFLADVKKVVRKRRQQRSST